MMRKSLVVAVFMLFVSIECSSTDDGQNMSKDDFIFLIEKIDKIFQENPYLLERLVKYWKQHQEQNRDFKDERWDNSVAIPETSDDSVLRYMNALLNNDEIKRKRGYHRALCHFKICNMGSKRSPISWEWPRNNPQ